MALSIEQQQQQLYKLNAELSNLKKEQSRLSNLTKGGLVKKFDSKSIAGRKALQDLADITDEINAKQKEYDTLNKTLKEAKTESEVVSEVGSAEEARNAALAGFKPNEIEEYRTFIANKVEADRTKKSNIEKAKADEVKSQELQNELANAGKFIAQGLDKQGRIDLAAQLNKVYNIKLPLNGVYSPALKSAYTQMLADKFERSLDEGRTISVKEFLEIGTAEGSYRPAGGEGGPKLDISISSPTQAASTIQTVFSNVLNREATPEEISKLTVVLNNAEKKAGRKTKTVGGRTEYTTDLDRIQFLTEEVKKIKDPKTGKSEFETKRGEKESIIGQALTSVAKANGMSLSQDQLNSYLTEIRNGKDINVIRNDIRYAAGLGRPESVKKLLQQGTDLETIYSPYKKTMAALLEVNPDSIDLNDTTLQSAITDRELPIYEFRKLLKIFFC